jgi:hypothetical protein
MFIASVPEPVKIPISAPQGGVVVTNPFLNRFVGFGVQRPVQTPKKGADVDNSDLDQRVRASGEW